MNVIKTILKRILYALALNQGIIILLCLIALSASEGPYLKVKDLFGCLLISCVVVFANMIFKLRMIPFFVRIIINYICNILTFLFTFIGLGKIQNTSSKIIIFVFLYTIVYSLYMIIKFIILKKTKSYEQNYSTIHKKKEPKEEYTSHF